MNIDLENFNGVDIKVKYQEICDKYAEQCCEVVKSKSPVNLRGRYREGWKTNAKTSGENIYSVTVWNATDWQLTHLLENGHLIVNKRNGAGWASAYPHIKPAFDSVKGKFKKEINKVELDIIAK